MRHCIIIPCYNEEERLNLNALGSYLRAAQDYQIVLVNDGSIDDTEMVCNKLLANYPHQVQVISLEKNSGKAAAVRFGMQTALSQSKPLSIGFLDADLSTPLHEYQSLVASLDFQKNTFAMATRILNQKKINYSKGRIFGRIMVNLFTKRLFQLDYKDTQCGAKVFSADTAKKLFKEPFTNKWLFDIELILRYHAKFPGQKITEYELQTWSQADGSKMKLSDKIMMPWGMLNIYRKYF